MTGITKKFWMTRMAERADLSCYLFHLTRPANESKSSVDATEMLLKILTEKRLRASGMGFINGGTPVVCLHRAIA